MSDPVTAPDPVVAEPADFFERHLLRCIRNYGITCDALTDEEIASEMVLSLFPPAENYGLDNPAYYETIRELGVCSNCFTSDCHCCLGCGGIDADTIGSHGHWCAL